MGLLGKDKMIIVDGGELVIPENKSLDTRNLLNIETGGKLTISENATLYNIGQIKVDGTLNDNGSVYNGARSTAGNIVRVGIGEINSTGTININNVLENVEGVTFPNTGTIINPSEILLKDDGKLVNNTKKDITIKKDTNGVTEDLTIPGIKEEINPKTFDSITIYIIMLILTLLGTVYLKKKKLS